MSLRPACAAQGPYVHKKGNNVPLVVVGIFLSPHNQKGSESSLHAFAFSVRIEKSYCLFSMCLFSFCPLQNS